MRTINSDVYSLGLVMLQVYLGEPDVSEAKRMAQNLWEGESFHNKVDPLMPG